MRIVYGVSLKDVSSGFMDIDIDTFLSKAPHHVAVTKNFMQEQCRESLG